jgi:hypothetical protein
MSNNELNRSSLEGDPKEKETGLMLAVIISHLDPDYMGSLQVEKLRQVGNDTKRTGQMATVRYVSPFMGHTAQEYTTKNNDYEGTQKTYGMWMIPPDVGTIVVCFFLEGDPARGFYFGAIQDKDMNFMIPGYAATKFHADGDEERVPVAEWNRKSDPVIKKDTTRIEKPQHPFATIYKDQGLLKDDIRGITSSSARREWPSSVFGISTPGPIDKLGPKADTGKHEFEAKTPWSRLGGTSFVMDDGDDKFLRLKPAGGDDCGPPIYAAVEDGELNGDRKLLHNELVRLRTRTGHQILLHNTEDLIYIGNARGTAWIELTSDGKMDIYCADSINIRTKKDFNFYADRDFNFDAGRNFNIRVGFNQKDFPDAGEMQIETRKDYNLLIGKNGNIQVGLYGDIADPGHLETYAKGHIWETSGLTNETRALGGNIIETAPNIHMNGPTAQIAVEARDKKPFKLHKLPDLEKPDIKSAPVDLPTGSTILRRVPTPEPYPHHENLDPERFKPQETDRDGQGRRQPPKETSDFKPPADKWKEYTTSYDTFDKVKK